MALNKDGTAQPAKPPLRGSSTENRKPPLAKAMGRKTPTPSPTVKPVPVKKR